MKENKTAFISNLVNDAEQLMLTTKQMSFGTKENLNEIKIEDKLLREELESLQVPINLNLNGRVEIRLSNDEMIAYADFIPPSGNGELITIDQFTEVLTDRKITYGLDKNKIEELVFQCNTERKEIPDQIIARGLDAVSEIPEHLELVTEIKDKTHGPDHRSNGTRIDYKETNFLVLVEAGERLARIIPQKTGMMGQTVTGKAIPYHIQKALQLLPGENTQENDGQIIAACDGRFIISNSVISVREVLEVFNDIDYSVGNLKFPKDVILHGRVEDGFLLNIGGSLICNKTLNATIVNCGVDLTISGGIIGRHQGIVTVGGSIHTDFIENSHVEAGEGIQVKKSILNSFVYSQGEIILGSTGKILGGKIYAGQGVQAYQIGSSRSPKTEIICGIDFQAQRDLFAIRDRTFELARIQTRLKKIYTKYPTNESIPKTISKIKETLQNLQEKAASLLSRLHTNEGVEIKVFGGVYPGVSIEICNVVHVVTNKLAFVVFRLDKNKGKIMTEKLKAQHATNLR
jgi:uncharacterized protein (DUF342 family)